MSRSRRESRTCSPERAPLSTDVTSIATLPSPVTTLSGKPGYCQTPSSTPAAPTARVPCRRMLAEREPAQRLSDARPRDVPVRVGDLVIVAVEAGNLLAGSKLLDLRFGIGFACSSPAFDKSVIILIPLAPGHSRHPRTCSAEAASVSSRCWSSDRRSIRISIPAIGPAAAGIVMMVACLVALHHDLHRHFVYVVRRRNPTPSC